MPVAVAVPGRGRVVVGWRWGEAGGFVFRRLKVSLRNLCCPLPGYAFLFVLIISLPEMGNCNDAPFPQTLTLCLPMPLSALLKITILVVVFCKSCNVPRSIGHGTC